MNNRGGEGSSCTGEGRDWPWGAEGGYTWAGPKCPGNAVGWERDTGREGGTVCGGRVVTNSEMADFRRRMNSKCGQWKWGAGGGAQADRRAAGPPSAAALWCQELEEGVGTFNT